MTASVQAHAANLSAAADTASGVLLVVTTAEEIAKRIESHLRNAGHPLRVTWVHDRDDIEMLLRDAPPDVLLCDRDVRGIPRDRIIALVRSRCPDLPVVLISKQWSLEASVAALAAGAQDFAAYEDVQHLRHLELIVLREFSRHRHLQLLRKTQAQLGDYESRHQQLTDCTSDAMGLIQEGILAGANLAFVKLLGFDNPSDLAGQPLIDLVEPEQRGKIKERLRAIQKGKHVGELLQVSLVGKTGPVEVSAQLILGLQDGEQVIELLIRPLAVEVPAATGAPALRGRSSFAQALCEPHTDAHPKCSAVLLHVDDFEGLETRIGHADAQDVSLQIIESVRSHIGPLDRAFVFSTDEIALLLVRPDLPNVEHFAGFLRKTIKDQIFSTPHHEAQATVSIAIYPLAADDGADTVIRQLVAEARGLSARGGDQVILLGATAKASLKEREEARHIAHIKKVLEDGGFNLAYQSIASLEGEARSHFDILLRMPGEDGREQHAAEFLPLATRHNLMASIDRWVVGSVLGVIARRSNKEEPQTLFVKLSEDTLCDSDAFIVWLKALTRSKAMKSDEIVFELQEQFLQNHIRKAKTLTQALAGMGAGIAIEHFGIGSHSAQLLNHIQAGFLKFHASITKNFAEKETQKLLTELIGIAKQRQIKTIVSHVEDANVMARLWQMGVNFIQGYHIKEPEVVQLTGDVGSRSRR